ncbi:Protein of unknown function [Loktanella fryxellensis]|uniref:Uncharacterized protein n=1 Tax=Loktanella fryxellensis TaxID=245187 RepID=A0A1H8CW97_9RHOB|nr:DUF3618 domain-containing protein [Loktanella fryxellensis]SEM98608.1 Protein of unknown function [Loktanella fryxellensis]
MTADYRTAKEIEAEIAAERAKLSGDLSMLQDRLTVDGLMDEVRMQVRGQIDEVTMQLRGQFKSVGTEVFGTMRDQIATTGDVIARSARSNPWPYAVIGAGLAWLAVSQAMPERGKPKTRIGMAPVKSVTPVRQPRYDSSPADMAAARLERDADGWATAVLDAQSHAVPSYDRDDYDAPGWARDETWDATRRL